MGKRCRSGARALTRSWPVVRFDQIDSTNTEARRRAQSGAVQAEWIIADRQSAGRGRQDKVWLSPAGNVYATALFAEPGGIQVALRVPFAAALAVADTAVHFAPDAPVKLKWPNDVRADGRKMSGILVETGGEKDTFWIAAGTGINVLALPDNPGQPATSLSALAGQPLELEAVLDVFCGAFEARLGQARAGFEAIRQAWLERAEGLGEAVSVRAGSKVIEGVFEDMEADGGLRLRLPDGTAKVIRAGEVNLLGRV